MVEWTTRSRRKKTGGIDNSVNAKSKSLSNRGGTFSKTTIDSKEKMYKEKARGGNSKIKIIKSAQVVISDGSSTKKGKLLNVIENSADKHFVRQKVITKGTVITAEIDGKEVKAKVTSRPGQAGIISAVLFK